MVQRDLATVPHHIGVNNHMGSKGTANAELMRIILSEIKMRRLFFLDSQTTPDSKVPEVAEQLGTPYLTRDIFLDNVDDAEAIRRQVDKVRSIAARQGHAVAIGHFRPSTLKVLGEEIPKLESEGFEVVKLSELNHYLNR